MLLEVSNCIDRFTCVIKNLGFHCQTAIQAVRSAGQSRVIGTYGRFYVVEHSLIILAVLDYHLRRLFDGHVDRSGIMRCSDDEVSVYDKTIIIACVVVD